MKKSFFMVAFCLVIGFCLLAIFIGCGGSGGGSSGGNGPGPTTIPTVSPTTSPASIEVRGAVYNEVGVGMKEIVVSAYNYNEFFPGQKEPGLLGETTTSNNGKYLLTLPSGYVVFLTANTSTGTLVGSSVITVSQGVNADINPSGIVKGYVRYNEA